MAVNNGAYMLSGINNPVFWAPAVTTEKTCGHYLLWRGCLITALNEYVSLMISAVPKLRPGPS